MLITILFILTGIITGLLMGVVGIGGGALLIPMLMMLGLSIKQAVAMSLVLQMVPQTLPGVYLYYKQGHVKIYKSIALIIGSVIGVFIGSYLVVNNFISEKIMMYALGGCLLIIGILMLIYNYIINR
jgi:uncharacterized membrane protein YfcA